MIVEPTDFGDINSILGRAPPATLTRDWVIPASAIKPGAPGASPEEVAAMVAKLTNPGVTGAARLASGTRNMIQANAAGSGAIRSTLSKTGYVTPEMTLGLPLEGMSLTKKLLIGAAIVAVGVGGYFYFTPPKKKASPTP